MIESSGPVQLTFEGSLEVARWRPLVNWLLAIPQFVVAYALQIVQRVLTVVAFFTILFTKKIPEPVFGFIVMTHRYTWRVTSYFLWMRESYPPFEFGATPDDPGTDPAMLTILPQAEYHRWLPLVKWFLAIPHYIALVFLFIGGFFVSIYGFFAVLFTGRWPEGARNFLVGTTRWSTRVLAYVGLLTDVYPPFSLN
jgi:roadblock/LC7 domain-containing protein